MRPGALAALALTAIGCSDSVPTEPVSTTPSRDASVTWASDQILAQVDPRFLSYASDTAQVLGGPFWSNSGAKGVVGDQIRPPLDYDDPELRALAAPLSPAFFRIGGSAADTVYVDLGDTPVAEAPAPYELVLTAPIWERVMRYVEDLDLELLFTLNAGEGPRDQANVWQPDQARALLEHAASRGDDVAVWELGNEINGFLFILGPDADVSPEAYADDFAVARQLVDEVDPDALLAGPSSAYWPLGGELNPVLPDFLPAAGPLVDVVTWHYYPQQSDRCPIAELPADIEMPLTPALLDNVDIWAADVESYRDAHASQAPVWLGETGGAQCGGQIGLSDRYVGSFWWLDQLGLLARRGQPIVIRQSFTDATYGLLDGDTLEPRPDYYASVLHKRLMGTEVLDVTGSDELLRVYAHCTKDGPPGSVSMVVLNLSTTEGATLSDFGVPSTGAEVYLLDAEALDAPTIRLHGIPLARDGGQLPDLDPVPLTGALTLPPPSYAFVVLPKADVAACL